MFLVAIAQSGVAVEDKAEGLIEVGIVEVGLDGLGYYQKQGAGEKHWDCNNATVKKVNEQICIDWPFEN